MHSVNIGAGYENIKDKREVSLGDCFSSMYIFKDYVDSGFAISKNIFLFTKFNI